jgi:hypothetical protein
MALPTSIRHLFLHNEACIGVFISQGYGKVFIILSSSGEYINIRRGDRDTLQLTRFCPVAMEDYVRNLLHFRNKYASRPYICERFRCHEDFVITSVFANTESLKENVKIQNSPSPSINVAWDIHQLPSSESNVNGWTVYKSLTPSNGVYLCPSGRRVFATLDVFLDAEDVCQRGARGTPMHKDTVSVAFPIGRAPADILDLIHRLRDGNEEVVSRSLLCTSCNSSNAYKATLECEELRLSLERLICFQSYPVGHMVLVEHINGVEYLLSSPAPRCEVEAWVDNNQVLAIQGDLVSLYSSSAQPMVMHLALLLTSDLGHEPTDLPPSVLPCGMIQKHKQVILQLLSYRRSLCELAYTIPIPPSSCMRLFSDAEKPAVNSIVEFTSGNGNKYTVISTANCAIFRAAFSDSRLLLSYSPPQQVVSPSYTLLLSYCK